MNSPFRLNHDQGRNETSPGGNRGSTVALTDRPHWRCNQRGPTDTPFLAQSPCRRQEEACALSEPIDFASIPVGWDVSVLVDPADYPQLMQWKWLLLRSSGRHAYAGRFIGLKPDRKLLFMHRFLAGAAENQRVRHINGNGLDNRRANLVLHTLTSSPEERAKNNVYHHNRRARIAAGIQPRGLGQQHILSSVDTETRMAICSVCGPVMAGIRNRQKDGARRTEYRCSVALSDYKWRAKRRKAGRDPGWITSNYQKYKGGCCERCGFVPVHSIQLDVHHRDHNHDNHEQPNLETVCANCHRLEHLPRWYPDWSPSQTGEAA